MSCWECHLIIQEPLDWSQIASTDVSLLHHYICYYRRFLFFLFREDISFRFRGLGRVRLVLVLDSVHPVDAEPAGALLIALPSHLMKIASCLALETRDVLRGLVKQIVLRDGALVVEDNDMSPLADTRAHQGDIKNAEENFNEPHQNWLCHQKVGPRAFDASIFKWYLFRVHISIARRHLVLFARRGDGSNKLLAHLIFSISQGRTIFLWFPYPTLN